MLHFDHEYIRWKDGPSNPLEQLVGWELAGARFAPELHIPIRLFTTLKYQVRGGEPKKLTQVKNSSWKSGTLDVIWGGI